MTNEITFKDFIQAWGQPEKAREILREAFLPYAEDPGDPHDLKYYEDLAEVISEFHRDFSDPLYFVIEIAGEPYKATTEYELEFLAWIRQLMRRGLDFEQAFVRAGEIITQDRHLDHIVYELEQRDDFQVNVWIEILTDQGIEETRARVMAEDIVRVLNQAFYVEDGDWFDEYEAEKCEELLERLQAVRASEATA